jgi:hypothetical protein
MRTPFGQAEQSWGKQELQERARRARQILDDPVFQAAVQLAEQDTIDDWIAATTVEGREQAWARMQSMQAVQQSLTAFITYGE